jgi:hypothetical protein
MGLGFAGAIARGFSRGASTFTGGRAVEADCARAEALTLEASAAATLNALTDVRSPARARGSDWVNIRREIGDFTSLIGNRQGGLCVFFIRFAAKFD